VLADAESMYLDGDNQAGIERYVTARGLVHASDLPIVVERAGAGNMNLTLRVVTAAKRSFILKQGRPWVEKYKHIPAPGERTLVEGAFYSLVQADALLAARMPSVIDFDGDSRVLVLEDVRGSDCTSIYQGEKMPAATIAALLDWLARLGAIRVPADSRDRFANRAMRALNHEHMFRFPLDETNGLDLDAMTPGLRGVAGELIRDRAYCHAAAALGSRYLADGDTLVHGDYFPGSWLGASESVRIIATYIGLALILLLMIFVFWQDIERHILPLFQRMFQRLM